jgi:hypothetical protein
MACDSFWEVLAGRLGDLPSPSRATAASRHGSPVRQTWDPGLRFVLLGGLLPSDGHLTPARRTTPRESFSAQRSGTTAARPGHPRRLLTDAQRAAVEVLRASGASDLGEGFTAAELRSAYRRLALRWHPDRHAAAAPAERAWLAQTFARITSAYRQLAGDLRRAA